MEIKKDGDGMNKGIDIDSGFISKYIREDNNDNDAEKFKERFKVKSSIEVFGNVGEAEARSEGNGFNNRFNKKDENPWDDSDNNKKKRIRSEGESYNEDLDDEDNNYDDSNENKKSNARREFLDELNKDSLTLDTCERINHDWR